MAFLTSARRLAVLVCSLFVLPAGGCGSKDVASIGGASELEAFVVSGHPADKVDLLFVIDNSASMAEKQRILASSLPALVEELLHPRCVDERGFPSTDGERARFDGADPRYGCPPAYHPEAPPVVDMHVGIVSSSLGSFGGDVCPDGTGHFNDRGRLLDRVESGTPANVTSSNFLAWFPESADNADPVGHPPPEIAIGSIDDIVPSFQDLVVGAGEQGCGFEAQLESWYRFLVQPDPWERVTVDANGQAVLEGIDMPLLRQRADFLRPDSLVAIVVLTDEDDASVDPLSLGGRGWAYMNTEFPGSLVQRGEPGAGTTAPRGTSVCKTNPGAKDEAGRDLCTSCGFARDCDGSDPVCRRIADDPECRALGAAPPPGASDVGYAGYHAPADDALNVRFYRMKERFGVDPRFPIQRYVDGLTKPRVPDRTSEHPEGTPLPNGRRDIEAYTNTPKCTNPLFAAKLPRLAGDELCHLPRGTRSPSRVVFSVIGGVPHQLLHTVPGDPVESQLTDADWIAILGRDPRNFDFDGIDPHMIASVVPRPGLAPPSDVRGDNGPDPIHGREWNTNGEDLQIACAFDLPVPRTCAPSDAACECAGAKNPPTCGATEGTIVRAKAYPSIRELMVARALGDSAVVGSICPIQVADPSRPDYGYRPVVARIADQMKTAATKQCLHALRRDASGKKVPCVLATELPGACDDHGLAPAPSEVLEQLAGDVAGVGPSGASICEIPQLAVERGETCADVLDVGWCYVEHDDVRSAARGCAHEFVPSLGVKKLPPAPLLLFCPKGASLPPP